jgi:hypothetical protein
MPNVTWRDLLPGGYALDAERLSRFDDPIEKQIFTKVVTTVAGDLLERLGEENAQDDEGFQMIITKLVEMESRWFLVIQKLMQNADLANDHGDDAAHRRWSYLLNEVSNRVYALSDIVSSVPAESVTV